MDLATVEQYQKYQEGIEDAYTFIEEAVVHRAMGYTVAVGEHFYLLLVTFVYA